MCTAIIAVVSWTIGQGTLFVFNIGWKIDLTNKVLKTSSIIDSKWHQQFQVLFTILGRVERIPTNLDRNTWISSSAQPPSLQVLFERWEIPCFRLHFVLTSISSFSTKNWQRFSARCVYTLSVTRSWVSRGFTLRFSATFAPFSSQPLGGQHTTCGKIVAHTTWRSVATYGFWYAYGTYGKIAHILKACCRIRF